MRLLFLGDVVGKPGRRAIRSALPALREGGRYDAVIANGENAAGGFGLTPTVAEEFWQAGVDLVTLGNHTFANREIGPLLEKEPRIIRPVNYPAGAPGRGSGLLTLRDGSRLGVLNLLGRVFLEPLDDPFVAAERECAALRAQTPYLLVDFHAEATSEKLAMGWFLDGRVSALVGTHTHVQTADERILPKGTGYITDVGMCGPTDGILGVDRDLILRKFRTQLPVRFEVAGGPVSVNALALEFDAGGRTTWIERIRIDLAQ